MTGNTSSTPTSTPTFPIPASARVHPITTASGTIAPAKVTTPTTTIPTTTVKSPVVSRPATHIAKHSETLSTAAIVLAVLAAVLLLACIGWALARRRALEPRWMLSLRHAMAEAGFRLSATCAEFADWVRLGH